MTQDSRPKSAQLARQLGLKAFAAAAICLLLGPLGCDTVAEITFHNEILIEIVPEGFRAAHCGQDKKATVNLRFSVLTSSDARLEPGKTLSSLDKALIPGQNFTAKNVLFTDAWLFAIDETGADKACTTKEDCQEGESCLSITSMALGEYYYAPGSYCVIATKIEHLSAPSFEHYGRLLLDNNTLVSSQNASGRSFAFALDNSASLDGSDQNGSPNATRATDPLQYRKVGLMGFIDALTQGSEDSGRLEFAAYFANGQGKTGVYTPSQQWIKSIPLWQTKVIQAYPSPSGQSPIWETALASLEAINRDSNDSYAPNLIAFTDGPANPNSQSAKEAFEIALSSAGKINLNWLDYEKAGQPPNADYAQMAHKHCATYHFIDNASQIPSLMRQIAINAHSHWTSALKFTLPAANGRIYRLATTMVLSLGDNAVSYAAHRVLEHNEVSDRRFVVVNELYQ